MNRKENYLKCIHHETPEWVPFGSEATTTLFSPVVERSPGKSGFDSFGVHWSFNPLADGGTYPTPGKHPVSEPTAWRESVAFPDLDSFDWESVAMQAASVDRNAYLVQGFVEMGIFERSYLLLGMERALEAYLTDTDTMIELASAIADYKIRVIYRLDDAIDMDILWYGDDWGTQTGLFLPPDIWRRVIRPHTERIFQAAHDRNIRLNQHSCGKIDAVISDLVDMGADMWNPCQPCNDLVSVKEQFGNKLVLIGGIDSQFVLGRPGVTADEVKAEVKRRIYNLAPGGGYIAAPSHSVQYPDYVKDALHEAATRYGREIYRDRI